MYTFICRIDYEGKYFSRVDQNSLALMTLFSIFMILFKEFNENFPSDIFFDVCFCLKIFFFLFYV